MKMRHGRKDTSAYALADTITVIKRKGDWWVEWTSGSCSGAFMLRNELAILP
jgi:hypothetical protein